MSLPKYQQTRSGPGCSIPILLMSLMGCIVSVPSSAQQWPGIDWANYLGTEVCGDGVDNDGIGGDAPCVGDADLDGYLDENDCDSSNFQIYPGVFQGRSDGAIRQCRTDGAWSDWTFDVPAEGTRNFYIDARDGNDSNPGTAQAPWRSFANIRYAYRGDPNPATHIGRPQCGDVYYASGVFNQTYNTGRDPGRKHLMLRSVRCTDGENVTIRDWPGKVPPLFMAPSLNTQDGGLYLLQGDYAVDGLSFTGKQQNGITSDENGSFKATRINAFSNNGTDNNNPSGVHIRSCGVGGNGNGVCEVSHSRLVNNIDLDHEDTESTTENARNFVDFCRTKGSTVRLHHNLIYNTIKTAEHKGGGSIRKHGGEDCRLEIIANRYAGHGFTTIGSAGPNTLIQGNLIVDADLAFKVSDFGGPHSFNNIEITDNTVIGGRAFSFAGLVTSLQYGPVSGVKFHNNVVVDNSATYTQDKPFYALGTYSTEIVKNATDEASELLIDNNCLHNPNTDPMAVYFLRVPGGGMYTMPQWQSVIGHDINSYLGDPQLNDSGHATSTACSDKGYAAKLALISDNGGGDGGSDDSGDDSDTPDMPDSTEAAEYSIYLKTANGHYWSAANGGGSSLDARSATAGASERLTLKDLNGGQLETGDHVQIKTSNNTYWVVAEGGGGGALNANRTTPLSWETFIVSEYGGDGIIRAGDTLSLQALLSSHYIAAEGGGGHALNVNRTVPYSWERFTLIDASSVTSSGPVEYRANIRASSGHYWSADDGGGGSLYANRTVPRSWETFTLKDLDGGQLVCGDRIQVRTHNHHWVVAEGGGGGSLKANRTVPRSWETFIIDEVSGDCVIRSGDVITLRTLISDHYIAAEGGGGRTLSANRSIPYSWERFTLNMN